MWDHGPRPPDLCYRGSQASDTMPNPEHFYIGEEEGEGEDLDAYEHD